MKKRILHVLPAGIVRNRLSFRKCVSKLSLIRSFKDDERLKWKTHQALQRVLFTLLLLLHQLTRLLDKNPWMITPLLILILFMIIWLLKQILSQSKC